MRVFGPYTHSLLLACCLFSVLAEAAIDVDAALQKLGATRVLRRGAGNAQDEEQHETGWEDWEPEFWSELKIQEPPLPTSPAPAIYNVKETSEKPPELIVPPGAVHLGVQVNKRITPPDYDRDIRHLEFDLKGTGLSYDVGDCMAIYGQNDPAKVDEFLAFYGLKGDQVIQIEPAEKDGTLKAGVPPVLTIKQLFTEVLDLFGRPSRRSTRSSRCSPRILPIARLCLTSARTRRPTDRWWPRPSRLPISS